ncbi:29424_t:CDS:2, partial [Racocetra persica]
GCKQNCLVSIPGSSEKQELVKMIIHLPLNTLPEKFIKDINALVLTPLLTEEKILDWDLGYAMTMHTKGLPLLPEIEEAKNKKAIERSLRPFIFGKLVRYMDQDKKKGCEFNLFVDYILVLKDLQKNNCKLCLNKMLWEWDEAGNPDQ